MVLALIEGAEQDGSLVPGGHIVEPTSGSTGIALAFVAASKRYELTIFMPDTMTRERRVLLESLGARVMLHARARRHAPDHRGGAGVRSAHAGAWMPRQFENPANPHTYETTTGPEIWADTRGDVDIFVAGVGMGGTITGVTRFLRSKNPAPQRGRRARGLAGAVGRQARATPDPGARRRVRT